jgi:hypothetical protein
MNRGVLYADLHRTEYMQHRLIEPVGQHVDMGLDTSISSFTAADSRTLPDKAFNRVDFPAPLGPIIAQRVLAGIY